MFQQNFLDLSFSVSEFENNLTSYKQGNELLDYFEKRLDESEGEPATFVFSSFSLQK